MLRVGGELGGWRREVKRRVWVYEPSASRSVLGGGRCPAESDPGKHLLEANLHFERRQPKPVVKVQEAAPAVEAAPVAEATPAVQTTAAVETAAPAAPKTTAASGKGAAIAAAAYAQLGVSQDCTALATNALAAVGIHYHGWPAGYLSLGRTVSAAEAQPGDLAYYQNGGMGLAHIAVYVGNGQAVHGGWNGGTTALFSVNVGSGPVFIRVGG